MRVFVIAAGLFVSLAAIALAGTLKCGICDKPISGKYYQVEDRARGGKVEVCADCGKLDSRCFACALPVKANFTTLKDGRLLCARCGKETLSDDDEARKLALATRDELDRLLFRYLTFPSTNVVLTIVDRFTLESLFKSPGYGRRCSSVFGATQSHSVGDQRQIHSVSILSSLNKSRLQAVAAHECGHTWLNENLSAERRAVLAPDAIEAFCELVAHNLMAQHNDELELKAIRDNPYTRGQFEAFQTAQARHGFVAIVDWMKAGEAQKLDASDADEVLMVRMDKIASKPARLPLYLANTPAAPLPESLVLKSVSGTANRRFAIINDRNFTVAERAKIRLATTNWMVRCLEIRTNSVLIQIENTGEKKELFLPVD
jgi:hypothetical protein